jgi:hypothetical protein
MLDAITDSLVDKVLHITEDFGRHDWDLLKELGGERGKRRKKKNKNFSDSGKQKYDAPWLTPVGV